MCELGGDVRPYLNSGPKAGQAVYEAKNRGWMWRTCHAVHHLLRDIDHRGQVSLRPAASCG